MKDKVKKKAKNQKNPVKWRKHDMKIAGAHLQMETGNRQTDNIPPDFDWEGGGIIFFLA